MSDKKPSFQDLIKQEYKKCLASPVYFMKKYVKIQHPIRGNIAFDLYSFQEETLQSFHDYKFNIILKSRQMGISTLVSAFVLWEMIFHKDKNILIISLKQEDAKDVVTKVRFANENLPQWLKEKSVEDNRLSLKLENGSSVHGAATTKKSGVGKALSLLIIDEAALIEEADELWTSAQPTLSCLDKNELILTKNGFIRIDSLITKNTKIGFNSHDIIVDTMYGLQPSTDFYMSDKSDLYRVTFKSGGSILTTKEHPLMTLDGWKSVVDLKSNEDMVLSKYNQNLFGNEIDYTEFSPDIRKDSKKYKLSNKDIAYLCGLWIAEGHFIRGGIGITNIETSIVDWLINIGFKQYDDRHLIFHSTWMHELFKWIGCEGTSHTKKVPHRILSASKMEQIQFLRGLFDGDGCSLKEKGIKLTSVSHELVSNVRCMLLNFGIYSYIRPVTWKSTKSTVIKNKNSAFYGYELHIGGWDANNFYNNIGFSLERKQLNQKCLSKKSIKRIYPDKTAVKNLILESGLTIRNFSKKHKTFFDRYLWNGGNGLSISSVEKLLEVGDSSSKNYKLIHDQYIKDTTSYYDKVVSVIFEKNDFSYDIKVPNTECFIANGYINHNTGGNAIVLSTPRGVGNWFHRMWQGAEESKDGKVGKNGFHAIKLPWDLHPDRDEEWRRVEGEKQGSAKKAAQEYDCDFLASGDNVVDLNIVTWYKNTIQRDPAEIRGIDHGLWVWQYPDYSRSYIVCLPTGESVLTNTGIKNIEDITYDDKLISKDGHGTNIVDIKIRPYHGDIYEITPSNTFRSTKFTDEHPIYVSQNSKLERMYKREDKNYKFNQRYWKHDFKFISSKDLKVGDWICYPNIYKKQSLVGVNQIWNEFENLGRVDFQIKNNPLLNVDFWWFIGIWLAEGWCYTDKNGNVTIYTAHNSNETDIINKIKVVIKNTIGRTVSVTEKDNNTTICQFSSKQIGTFLTKYFGKYAKGKYISEQVKYLNVDFKQQLIRGYIAGDGCVLQTKTNGKNIKITSVSLRLLEDVQDILFSIGCISAINLLRRNKKSKIREKIINQREAYSLCIHDFGCSKILNDYSPKSKTQRISDCYFDENENFIYFKIKKIKKSIYNGLVHNFTTANGTFLCKNITTHNCADVARGDGEDFSACHVLDAISLDQCAEYKGSLGTKDFGNFLVALATEYNNAILIIERENVGWTTIQAAIDRNYPNLFYSSSELRYVDVQRQLRNNYDSEDRKIVAGFSTNMKTRPLIISHLEQYCKEEFNSRNGIKIYSKRTLAELDTFVWKNGKAQAMNSYHDDLLMALGIGLWVRDTALRLRQEGIDLTRSTLSNTSVVKSNIPAFSKSNISEQGSKSWQMQTGKQGFGKNSNEDIRWLLS